MERVFGLDLLRAVAVLMVLAAHSRLLLPPRFAWASQLAIFGQLGVELFFVLSGFLIGGIVLRTFGDAPSAGTLLRFWTRRWFRTLPNYYLFLLVNALLWWSRGLPLPDLRAYGVFLQNPWHAGPRFFAESWSLATEEWFYLLFPILVLGASRVRPRLGEACVLGLGSIFVVSVGARLVAPALWEPSWSDLSRGVVFRLDAPMVGVLGAWVKATWPAAWARTGARTFLCGLALLAVSSALVAAESAGLGVRAVALVGCSCGVLLGLPALDAWRDARGLVAAGIRRISLWSYSLYLCHLPVLSLVGHPGRALRHALQPTPRAALMVAAFFVLSIAAAALSYRFFERPTTRLRERWARR